MDAGIDTLVLSDKVPVRGLVLGKDKWSSSSGVHNHETTMTLLNHGRFSEAQLKKLLESQDPIDEEVALWKALHEKQ